jgi:hypothetical protein
MQTRSEAAFITGNQAFISNATTSAPGNNINNASLNLNLSTLSGGSSQTGDFIGVSETFNVVGLDTTTNATLLASLSAFGSASFGTFTALFVNNNDLTPGVARVINVTGTYTAGPGVGSFDPTPATLSITINQASPGVLSASATLAATAALPEPGSLVLLATFGIPAAFGWMRHRRRKIGG